MNHPNRSKQQQPTHTALDNEISTWMARGWSWEIAARLANVSAVVNERDHLKVLNAELLAALDGLLNCFNSSGEIEETAEDQLSVALENAEKAQAKAEGR